MRFGKFHSTYPLISEGSVLWIFYNVVGWENGITYVICIVFIDICLIHYGIRFGSGMITIFVCVTGKRSLQIISQWSYFGSRQSQYNTDKNDGMEYISYRLTGKFA